MADNMWIDYAPNHRLYGVIRNVKGEVWHVKRKRFVKWKDEEEASYCIVFAYKGGDRYVMSVPPALKTKKLYIQVFKMTGRKPENRLDNLISSSEALLKVQDYPKKHRGYEKIT